MYFDHAEHIRAWENDYKQKGRLWKGAPLTLPDLPHGFRVLELGCGNGKTLSAMLKCTWKITALDVSLQAIKLSRDMTTSQSTSSEVNFVVSDASCLPFQKFSFDVVFAVHVIGHGLLDERRHMILEAARVLRGGGQLFFQDFELEDIRSQKGEEIELHTFRRGRGILTHYFTEEEVMKLFEMLRPVSIKTQKRKIRIMGRDHIRSEVKAQFIKVES
ncbi:MAG: class I SAM-dependent methyltransferase [Methanotrichaceae archaeon]